MLPKIVKPYLDWNEAPDKSGIVEEKISIEDEILIVETSVGIFFEVMTPK